MSRYYYLDVLFLIESKKKVKVDKYKLKEIITNCIRNLFGEAGAANQVDILKYEEKTGRIILRCFANFYVKLRASLSFGHRQDNFIFSFQTTQASPSLVSLQANSDIYDF